MGLFDSIVKQVLGGAKSGSRQDKAVDALGGLLNQVGGIDGLMQRAKSAGLEGAVSSWISTGQNESVTPEQMENLLGKDAVQDVAAKAGFSAQQLLPLLAQFFPMVIDKLTPNGRVEKGATSAQGLDLGGVLVSIMGSQGGGGIAGLLGGLLGGKK